MFHINVSIKKIIGLKMRYLLIFIRTLRRLWIVKSAADIQEVAGWYLVKLKGLFIEFL